VVARRERKELRWRSMANDGPSGRAATPSGPQADLGCGVSSGPMHKEQRLMGSTVTGVC
jgi:hypothetical protein